MQERRVHFASLNARKYATGLVVIQCSISEDDYGLAPQLLAATGQLRNAGWAGPVRETPRSGRALTEGSGLFWRTIKCFYTLSEMTFTSFDIYSRVHFHNQLDCLSLLFLLLLLIPYKNVAASESFYWSDRFCRPLAAPPPPH